MKNLTVSVSPQTQQLELRFDNGSFPLSNWLLRFALGRVSSRHGARFVRCDTRVGASPDDDHSLREPCAERVILSEPETVFVRNNVIGPITYDRRPRSVGPARV